METLRDRFECLVLSVHHSGKDADRGMRGSTAYKGAADVELKAQAVDIEGGKVFTLSASKIKDGAESAPFIGCWIRIRWSVGGVDVDGEPVKSA
ncbi:hypothetical protein P0Y35_05825 [Kiritimatiellaeota bacterium B1221]|nr:hypothetical protein [Kiritimatiellaeota bacterium B1221]